MVVRFCYRLIVLISIEVFEVFSILGFVVVHGGLECLHVLVVHLGLVDFLSNLVGLLLEEISGGCILHQYFILMCGDVDLVGCSSLVVQLSLLFLFLHHIGLMRILVLVIRFTSHSDLVSEFRVLVGDLDLSLKSSLLILKFPKSILHHLGLQGNITFEYTLNLTRDSSPPTSNCFCLSCNF